MGGPPYRPLDAQVIPRFAGIRTFMRAPHVDDLTGVDAAVYGIPFDTATSYRTGPRFGPEAIRSASALLRPYNPALEVNVVEALSLVDYGDLPVSPGDTERTYAQVEEALAPVVEAGVFAAAMGGDHSVTLAELRALARRHGPLALVQLDSHGDVWERYFGHILIAVKRGAGNAEKAKTHYSRLVTICNLADSSRSELKEARMFLQSQPSRGR